MILACTSHSHRMGHGRMAGTCCSLKLARLVSFLPQGRDEFERLALRTLRTSSELARKSSRSTPDSSAVLVRRLTAVVVVSGV